MAKLVAGTDIKITFNTESGEVLEMFDPFVGYNPPMPEYGMPLPEPDTLTVEGELKYIHPGWARGFGGDAMADNPRLKTPLRHRPKKGDLGTITEGKDTPVSVRVTKDVPDDGDSVLVVPAKVGSDDSPRKVKLDEYEPDNAKAVAGLMAALVGVRARAKGRTSELTQEGSDEEFERRCRATVKRIAAKVKKRDAAIHECALKAAIAGGFSYERAVRDIRRLVDKPTVQIGELFSPTPHQRRYVEAQQEQSAASEWRDFIGQDFEAMGITGSAFGPGCFLLSVRSGHCCYVYDESFQDHGRAQATEFIEKHRTWSPVTRGPVVRVDDDGTREVVVRVESWHWEERGDGDGPWVLHIMRENESEGAYFIRRDRERGVYHHGPKKAESRYCIATDVAYMAGLSDRQATRAAYDFVNGVFQ